MDEFKLHLNIYESFQMRDINFSLLYIHSYTNKWNHMDIYSLFIEKKSLSPSHASSPTPPNWAYPIRESPTTSTIYSKVGHTGRPWRTGMLVSSLQALLQGEGRATANIINRKGTEIGRLTKDLYNLYQFTNTLGTHQLQENRPNWLY